VPKPQIEAPFHFMERFSKESISFLIDLASADELLKTAVGDLDSLSPQIMP
jgi:hypothetical protein